VVGDWNSYLKVERKRKKGEQDRIYPSFNLSGSVVSSSGSGTVSTVGATPEAKGSHDTIFKCENMGLSHLQKEATTIASPRNHARRTRKERPVGKVST